MLSQLSPLQTSLALPSKSYASLCSHHRVTPAHNPCPLLPLTLLTNPSTASPESPHHPIITPRCLHPRLSPHTITIIYSIKRPFCHPIISIHPHTITLCVTPASPLPERLLAVDVCGISCGSHHVVVVAADGVVFAWGRGEGGRLGTGAEDDACVFYIPLYPLYSLSSSSSCFGIILIPPENYKSGLFFSSYFLLFFTFLIFLIFFSSSSSSTSSFTSSLSISSLHFYPFNTFLLFLLLFLFSFSLLSFTFSSPSHPLCTRLFLTHTLIQERTCM